MSYEYVKNSRHNLKQRLLYIMGNKCCICGYDKCPSALEFHHKNPKEKEYSLGENTNIGFEKATQEIKKCILVCANCHREIHAFNLDISQYNCFDENKFLEKQQELNDLKTKKIIYCKNCGQVISSKAQYCVKCSHLMQMKAIRPNREELKKLIRKESFSKIGNIYNVTDNSIRKWCKKEKLPSTKKEINSYSDQEWELI